MKALRLIPIVLLVFCQTSCGQDADAPASFTGQAPPTVQPNDPPAETEADDGGSGIALPESTDWRDLLGTAAQAAEHVVLGAEKGILFYAYDVLTYPNEPTELIARVHNAHNLEDVPGVTVTFSHDDTVVGSAVTDDLGMAKVTVLPDAVGDYYFTAKITEAGPDAPEDLLSVKPTLLVVSAREKETAFVIVDLDHTVVGSSFFHVLAGQAEPMPDSQDVLRKIGERYSLIYLTHRPEEMGITTKQWLIDQDFPRAPLLMAELSQSIGSSGEFKTGRLAEIKEAFPGLAIGIGDKLSDAEAYLATDMTAYLIPHYDRESDDMRDMARKIERMTKTDRLNVVDTWTEIEVGIFHKITYPADKYTKRLRRRADEAARQERDDDDDDDD